MKCGAAVKNEREVFFFPGVQEGKEGRAFFHLLQFPNQTHHRQSQEERPKGETRGTWLGSLRRSEGCGRRARSRRKARVSSAEVRGAGAGNKETAWGGEQVERRRTPGRLPEDPGWRKPKCHLNSTQEAGAWDLSALFSSNVWSASYKLPESAGKENNHLPP